MVSFLKIFLGTVSLFMVYRVAATAGESSLFKEWAFLGSIQLFGLQKGEEIQEILQHNLTPSYAEASVGRPGPSPGRSGWNSKFT